MSTLPVLSNPTADVDVDFGHYLAARQTQLAAHLRDGIPDYSFGLDATLRRRLASLGPMRSIAQAVTSHIVPYYKQHYMMEGVAVSPTQYPEVYAMGEACARRLGIGIPHIFIERSHLFNGFTFATNDQDPIIVLTNPLVQGLEPDELLFVIGHECGHIHNLHGVYNTMAVLLYNPLANAVYRQWRSARLLKVMTEAFGLFLKHWSRCAEITCDRAGLICCGDRRVAECALAKLVLGSSALEHFDLEEYLKQLDQIRQMPARFMEVFRSHPLIPRRIEALRLFEGCEVLHAWRPDLPTPRQAALSRTEADEQCERVISIRRKSA